MPNLLRPSLRETFKTFGQTLDSMFGYGFKIPEQTAENPLGSYVKFFLDQEKRLRNLWMILLLILAFGWFFSTAYASLSMRETQFDPVAFFFWMSCSIMSGSLWIFALATFIFQRRVAMKIFRMICESLGKDWKSYQDILKRNEKIKEHIDELEAKAIKFEKRFHRISSCPVCGQQSVEGEKEGDLCPRCNIKMTPVHFH